MKLRAHQLFTPVKATLLLGLINISDLVLVKHPLSTEPPLSGPHIRYDAWRIYGMGICCRPFPLKERTDNQHACESPHIGHNGNWQWNEQPNLDLIFLIRLPLAPFVGLHYCNTGFS